MKRITAIELHNFLAFYGNNNTLSLPAGKNLLLYGENGSGKSSLGAALEVFFEARTLPNFEARYGNIWARPEGLPTEIHVKFEDKTIAPPHIVPVHFPSTVPLPWILESRLSSGFLTYRDILKTHFLEESRENLFDLVVNEILRGYLNPISGKVLSNEWQVFKDNFRSFLLEDPEAKYQIDPESDGADEIVPDMINASMIEFEAQAKEFDTALSGAINQLNPIINQYLAYFDQNVRLDLVINDRITNSLDPVKGTQLFYSYVEGQLEAFRKLNLTSNPDLENMVREKLLNNAIVSPLLVAEVYYYDQYIPDYQTFLNEARLSALATCIYLAALRLKPNPPEGCKVLFLDDVLIGLDSGNRLPLLRILAEHFQDFQIMISTYDRHWFEVAKDWLDLRNSDGNSKKWIFSELYERKQNQIPCPVFLESGSYLSKANNYIANNDYSAAANNLRKAAEKLLLEGLPRQEFKIREGNEKGEAPKFLMLSDLLVIAKQFFNNIEQPLDNLFDIEGGLKSLLNPLSHFNPETPIYKNELDSIQNGLIRLSKQLNDLRYKVVSSIDSKNIRIRIDSKDKKTKTYYSVRIKDYLYYYRVPNNTPKISNPNCMVFEVYNDIGGSSKFEKIYPSLENAVATLTSKFVNDGKIDPLPPEYNICDYLEKQIPASNTWQRLSDYLANIEL